ncbi:MAG: ATP-binding protein [Balneolales bacterium]
MADAVKHTITIPASTEYLVQVREFVAKCARQADFMETDIGDIRLAVDEACTNIIKHAYKYDRNQEIYVQIEINKNWLNITLLDSGIGFDPGNSKKPDIQESIRQKKRGGMGIYLIKKFMNKVEYSHNGTMNEIRMKKMRPSIVSED